VSSIIVPLDDDVKARVDKFSWVSWSEVAREVLAREEVLKEQLEVFRRIVSKSNLSEKDALEIGRKVKKAMHTRYKTLYPEAY